MKAETVPDRVRKDVWCPIVAKEMEDDGRLHVRAVMTSEALDSQGEVVDYDGAVRAMETWRGNVRDGHGGPGIGRAIETIPDEAERRVFVDFWISSGEPGIQKKALDGTYGGVSVGGNPKRDQSSGKVIGRRMVRVDDALLEKYPRIPETKKGQFVKLLLDWDMFELALMDEQANPDSAIQIVKSQDGQIVATSVLAKQEVTMDEETAGATTTPATAETTGAASADESSALGIIGQMIELAKKLGAIAIDEVSESGTYKLEELLSLLRQLSWMKAGEVSEIAGEAVEAAIDAAQEGSMENTEKGQQATSTTTEPGQEPGATTGDGVNKGQSAATVAVNKQVTKAMARVTKAIGAALKELETLQKEFGDGGDAADEEGGDAASKADGEGGDEAAAGDEQANKSQDGTAGGNAGDLETIAKGIGDRVAQTVAEGLEPLQEQVATLTRDLEAVKGRIVPGGPAKRFVSGKEVVRKDQKGDQATPSGLRDASEMPHGLTDPQRRAWLLGGRRR